MPESQAEPEELKAHRLLSTSLLWFDLLLISSSLTLLPNDLPKETDCPTSVRNKNIEIISA